MKLEYGWRMEGFFTGIDPQKIGNRLSRLETLNGGRLTKPLIYEDALRKDSPLHVLLETNAQTALEKHRMSQIHRALSNLVIVKAGKKTRRAAFVKVQMDTYKAQQFVSLVVAVRSPSMRKQLVERGARKLLQWDRQWGGMPEFEAIRPQLRRIKKVMEEQLLLAV